MVRYRLIGSGNVNADGVVSVNYTGVGVGLVDVIASTKQGVTDGLNSKIKEITDTILYDDGTIASHNDIYTYDATKTEITRYDTYTAITEKISGTDARINIGNLPSSVIMDFEYLFVEGNVASTGINIYNTSDQYMQFISLNDLGYGGVAGTWFKLRVIVGNGKVTMFNREDVSKTRTKTYTGTFKKFVLGTTSTITEIRLRNVKIYNM